MTHYSNLAHYRRTVAQHYQLLRDTPNLLDAAKAFRSARDELFRTHPLSPIESDKRPNFEGISYALYDPAWRFTLPIDYDVELKIFNVELPEGQMRYERFGKVHFTTRLGEKGQLSLFWILGYGGGVFLPFGDLTNGNLTYGGGRYLYDTIKGADLGITDTEIVLDFNFAYHPSCFYSHDWICPLTPPENRLPFPIPVGELVT